jgi:hypothetical protein
MDLIVDDDNDCTLWTVGSFMDPRLTSDQVSDRTGVMVGPSHSPANVTKMIVELGLGDGQYAVFNTATEASKYLLNSMMERFAFGMQQTNWVGHMVSAYRNGTSLTFLDFQVPPHQGTPVQPPYGPGWAYAIWPINDA